MLCIRYAVFALAVMLSTALAGCGDSNDDIQVEDPPLGIVATFPVDLADRENPPSGPTDLSVTFNRGTGVHEMQTSIYPPTASGAFTPTSSTRRSWTWFDVELDPAQGCYHWLIDGVLLGRYTFDADDRRVFVREPRVVRVASSTDRLPAVGFEGKVVSLNANVQATGTIVFVMPSASTTFNPLEPEGFDPSEATAVCVATRGDDFIEEPAQYTATMLVIDRAYIAVAIKDTNDDLIYNPADDWWGYYEDLGGLADILSKQDTGEKDSGYRGNVDITLRAPAPRPELPSD